MTRIPRSLASCVLLLPAFGLLASEPIDIGLTEEVETVSRRVQAVSFNHPGSVGTQLDLVPTSLASGARGTVDVDAKKGYVQLQATTWELEPAAKLGEEYMTYVLWAITPEGRATNLGELLADATGTTRSRLEVTTELQAFGMIVTAEPHFAVSIPSDVVVMEAQPTRATSGAVEPVEAEYELLRRGRYEFRGSSRADLEAPSGPFYIVQARNARRIAAEAGAPTHARDTHQKGIDLLVQAEGERRDRDAQPLARQAAQTFEDARLVAEESLRSQREAQARAEADAEARRADSAQREADAARLAAADADADRARAEAEKEALRARLQEQLTQIFVTRQTARGLILSMDNVLFDFNKSTLRPPAREKLARLAGVLVTTPGLLIEVEGHADAIGSDEYNLQLSQRRAGAVRDYLVENGVPSTTVTARGFGESMPIASNDTEAGRQQNRRVELVVSGESIGFGQ